MIIRNILLNPGPATTTDSVKMAQVVPDICPREKKFFTLMDSLRSDLLAIVHANPDIYSTVLFTGSGTINIDVCINSLVPADKKILVLNNGAYSSRAIDVCKYYGLSFIELKTSVFKPIDASKVEEILISNPDIGVVYTTHHETGTGVINDIRMIGEISHKYKSIFIVDTTSSYAMIPIDISQDNVDFCMASAQKGIQAMTGLSFIIGNKTMIEASKLYPKRSYYCNLYMQYEHFEKTGEMHFTPPVQTIYAAIQGVKEYFIEGELLKWERHLKVNKQIHIGLESLGFKEAIDIEYQSGLVVSVLYPNDINWDFDKVHDYCYDNGFTIYPGKISTTNTFRLCSLGAIYEDDIKEFFKVLKKALIENNIKIPIKY